MLIICKCKNVRTESWKETAKENDADFTAACDISASVSCSKVFASKYGKGFGLLEHFVGKSHWLNQPNSVFGLTFYILQMVLEQLDTPGASTWQLTLSCAANFGSVYLAYILYFILQDLCIVCITSYIINFGILLCNLQKINRHRTVSKSHSS
ncbi:Vitamin K epoxide reductase complex subunit 1 [Lamellibrachia satsuma]|nr:Vitamin K epoxide reductase complex subunit 1 [Lamellibrachia satsuma]